MIPEPFYSDDTVTLYCAPCETVLPHFAVESFDLLVTDPPYGIGADDMQAKRARRKQPANAAAPSTDYGDAELWDTPPPRWLLDLARSRARWSMICGGNYFELPLSRGWFYWNKETGKNTYSDGELIWSNLDQPLRQITYRWHGMLQKRAGDGGNGKEHRVHPAQKPVDLMKWLIAQAPDSCDSLVDPFAGCGSTLIAAKLLGLRRIVGVEMNREYCEKAVARLGQGALTFAD